MGQTCTNCGGSGDYQQITTERQRQTPGSRDFRLAINNEDLKESAERANTRESKLVVITGVSSGLGRALAMEFAQRDYIVVGCARRYDKLRELSQDTGSRHHFEEVDISDEGQVYEWTMQVLKRFGAPDILINNAATMNEPKNLLQCSYNEFMDVIDTNVMGTFYVLKYFAPPMNYRGVGTIVNMSSASGRMGAPLAAPYCASKFAIEGITQCLAGDLIDHPYKPPQNSKSAPMASRVCVVALSPGAVRTEMQEKLWPPEIIRAAMQPREWAKKTVPFIESIEYESYHGKSIGSPVERDSILRMLPDAEKYFEKSPMLAGTGRRVRPKRPPPLVLDTKRSP